MVDDKTGPIKIVGSLESFIVRLEDEYTKSLQQINPHTQVHYSTALTILDSYFTSLHRPTDALSLPQSPPEASMIKQSSLY